ASADLTALAGQTVTLRFGNHDDGYPFDPTYTLYDDIVIAGGAPAGGAIQTVFVILMENHNWSSVSGSASAPYLNGTLLPQAAYALNYQNPPGLHPSLPNY